MTRVGASAPGKALLCGEYAVLEGAPAVVAAVDRRATLTWSDLGERPLSPEVQATLEVATEECGRVEGTPLIDRSALRGERAKLGLGSSAAAAAATAGAVFATHGRALDDATVQQQLFDVALRGHEVVAPRGSGVDVAASIFGGFLAFQRQDGVPRARALQAPEGLAIALVWTGQPARTSDLLDTVGALRDRDPGAHREAMRRLGDCARVFVDAFDQGDAVAVTRAAEAYGESMDALGVAAGAPIVEARLRRTMEVTRRFGGGAKPSGAGGGDVAVAFFADEEAVESFKLACRAEGLHPIDVTWGAHGVTAG